MAGPDMHLCERPGCDAYGAYGFLARRGGPGVPEVYRWTCRPHRLVGSVVEGWRPMDAATDDTPEGPRSDAGLDWPADRQGKIL